MHRFLEMCVLRQVIVCVKFSGGFPGLLVHVIVELEVIQCTGSVNCLQLVASYLNHFELVNRPLAVESFYF